MLVAISKTRRPCRTAIIMSGSRNPAGGSAAGLGALETGARSAPSGGPRALRERGPSTPSAPASNWFFVQDIEFAVAVDTGARGDVSYEQVLHTFPHIRVGKINF